MENQREKLILDLQRIQENQYQLYENENAWTYSQLMLQYVGDTDPELRDDLIYATFCRWICEKEYFTNEELIKLLDQLLDENHLFFSIGNDGDDTVFTRTFSVLIIVLLLWKNRERSFLQIDKFINIKEIELIAKKYAELVKQEMNVASIYLYGSYVKGTNSKDSDIDIAIIGDEFTGDPVEDTMKLMKIRRKVDIRIEPHPFSVEDFDYTNDYVQEILDTGIKIM